MKYREKTRFVYKIDRLYYIDNMRNRDYVSFWEIVTSSMYYLI